MPSEGFWVRIGRTRLVKPLKFEVDNILVKEEFEHFGKEIVESLPDPASIISDPGPELLRTIARTVDDLSSAVRPFIRADERPEVDYAPSAAALAAVPVHPIDPALMASQMRMPMEGMEDPAVMNGGMRSPRKRSSTPPAQSAGNGARKGGMRMPGDARGRATAKEPAANKSRSAKSAKSTATKKPARKPAR